MLSSTGIVDELAAMSVASRLLIAALFSLLSSWIGFYLLVSAPLLWGESASFSTLFSTHHFSGYIALGYLSRFLGGVFFSLIIHRFSRSCAFHFFNLSSLVFCLFIFLAPFFSGEIMGVPFLGILHLAQSFFSGGHFIFLLMLVAENTPIHRRSLYSSIMYLPVFLGLFLCFSFSLFCYYFLSFHYTFYWAWPMFVLLPTLCSFISAYFFRSLPYPPHQEPEEGIPLLARVSQTTPGWLSLLALVLCIGLGIGMISFMFFYSFVYLTQTVHALLPVLFILFAIAVFVAIPLFLFFGWLSDRIGRLKLIMAALICAGLSYHGLFSSLLSFVYPHASKKVEVAQVVLNYNPQNCPVASREIRLKPDPEKMTMCSQFQAFFDHYGITIQRIALEGNKPSFLSVKGESFFTYDEHLLTMALQRMGYNLHAPFIEMNLAKLMVTIVIFIIYIAMVSGPALAYSIEVLPKRWRVMRLSFFYYVSNIWFFLFFIAYLFYTNPSFQLYHVIVWSAVIVCFLSVVACIFFLRDSYDPHNQCLIGHHKKEKPESSLGTDSVMRALSDLKTKDGQDESVLH